MRDKSMMIKKDNQLIMSGYRLTETAKKVILQFISLIRVDDTDVTEYTISLENIKQDLKVVTRNHDIFERITNELMRPFYISKNEKTAWVSYARIDGGNMTVKIAQELKPYLIDLKKNFTQYDYDAIVELNSFYAIRLFEIITMYQKRGQMSFDMSIVDIYKVLAIPTSYKWQDIKRQVLDSSQKQFIDKEINFEYKVIKKIGKKVDVLRFEILKRDNFLKSLQTFIKYCRDNFSGNGDIDYYPVLISTERGNLAISGDGFLYFQNSDANLNKDQAKKLWLWLYDLAKNDKLEILKKEKNERD
ncbi:MAG: replication initiation protein [Sulfurovaceae bacterium]|nr:replication initiation protein [Sulfurovaceae bacterium]MDD5360440.1 replication initiation protein [Sulfurovaceae bacterium]